MEQKYRIYGKVLLKNAGYTRITRTTCPSLPRFYKILWTRWMDGWMDGCSLIWDLEQSEKRSGLLPHLRFFFSITLGQRTEEGSRFFLASSPLRIESIEFRLENFLWEFFLGLKKKRLSSSFLKFNFYRLSDFF